MKVKPEIYVSLESGTEVKIIGDATVVKGSHSYNAPSDLDYYGYVEIHDWEALCDDGMSLSDEDRIELGEMSAYIEDRLISAAGEEAYDE